MESPDVEKAVSFIQPTASRFDSGSLLAASNAHESPRFKVDYSFWARCWSSLRSLSLPLCNCDFEVPALHPSIFAISSCS